ncbi:MAG: RNA polymerase factor sigma-32, partial [Rhodospirillales bacterium]|nr:RNA polymerase factor sigma-32 [Rhodospirillales bacterium]
MMADDNLKRYMREVRGYPLLSAETEAELVRRWREHGDRAALDRLVGSYQRLVVKIAGKYSSPGLPLGDLISEGNIGLLQAVEKYEVERGYRLSTYAVWWIRAAITDYVVRSSSLVRIVTNENRRKLFFNLRRLRRRYQPAGDGLLTPEAVAAIAVELKVPEHEVVLMDRHFAERDQSLNSAISSDTEAGAEWQDLLTDDAEDQEARVIDSDELDKRRVLLNDALAQLNERERHILIERKLRDDPPNLADLGVQYGVSRERVRQIE